MNSNNKNICCPVCKGQIGKWTEEYVNNLQLIHKSSGELYKTINTLNNNILTSGYKCTKCDWVHIEHSTSDVIIGQNITLTSSKNTEKNEKDTFNLNKQKDSSNLDVITLAENGLLGCYYLMDTKYTLEKIILWSPRFNEYYVASQDIYNWSWTQKPNDPFNWIQTKLGKKGKGSDGLISKEAERLWEVILNDLCNMATLSNLPKIISKDPEYDYYNCG